MEKHESTVEKMRKALTLILILDETNNMSVDKVSLAPKTREQLLSALDLPLTTRFMGNEQKVEETKKDPQPIHLETVRGWAVYRTEYGEVVAILGDTLKVFDHLGRVVETKKITGDVTFSSERKELKVPVVGASIIFNGTNEKLNQEILDSLGRACNVPSKSWKDEEYMLSVWEHLHPDARRLLFLEPYKKEALDKALSLFHEAFKERMLSQAQR